MKKMTLHTYFSVSFLQICVSKKSYLDTYRYYYYYLLLFNFTQYPIRGRKSIDRSKRSKMNLLLHPPDIDVLTGDMQ